MPKRASGPRGTPEERAEATRRWKAAGHGDDPALWGAHLDRALGEAGKLAKAEQRRAARTPDRYGARKMVEVTDQYDTDFRVHFDDAGAPLGIERWNLPSAHRRGHWSEVWRAGSGVPLWPRMRAVIALAATGGATDG